MDGAAQKAGALNAGLFTYLFGSPLTVSPFDVILIVALGVVIVVTIALIGRALFASVIDEGWARVAGLPVGALNAILAVLTAVTVVAAMKVVGVLLIAALLVLPVASGQILGRSFHGVLKWSTAVGAGSVVGGLVAARVWGLFAGPTIVLVAALTFALVAGVARTRRGRMPGVVHDVSGHAEPHDHPHAEGAHRRG
ncbi:MAG: metal ABC transporter permease [Actinobacteria bacterium]|nr:metal ABC transporter permease [Actinomycetota bacterium]